MKYQWLCLGQSAPPYIVLACGITCLAAVGSIIAALKYRGIGIRNHQTLPPLLGVRITPTLLLLWLALNYLLAWTYAFVGPTEGGASLAAAHTVHWLAVTVKLTLLINPMIVILVLVSAIRMFARAEAVDAALRIQPDRMGTQ